MNRIVSHLFLLFLLVTGLHPADARMLSGRVVDESGAAIAGATVVIEDQAVSTGPGGGFQAEVRPSGIHILRYSADGYFPAIHAYSPLDLAWSDTGEGASTVPDVTLVEKSEGRVLMVFGGDAMMGRRYAEPYPGNPVLIRDAHRAEDTRALLRHVKPYLELADFASVNLETQVMSHRPEGKAPKSYVFYTPPEAVAAFRDAGVDYVTLGNNHTNDYLAEGLVSTLDALEKADMPYSGAGLGEADALRPYHAEVGGHPYSFLGFVGWAGNFSPNQVAMGSDKSGAAFGTPENVKMTISREAGAGRLPIIQYHGSREYTDEPTLATETRLKHAVDTGAVLAIAHHPHITQGFEIYDGRLVAYSMGNFIFDQFHYATRFAYLLYVWLDGDRFHRAEVAPIHIQGYTPLPATDTVRRAVLQRAHALSSRRGIRMGRSGGNGVILPGNAQIPAEDAVYRAGRPGIESLHKRDWNATIEAIESLGAKRPRVRLGKNHLPMGHLENHFLLGAPDRSWLTDGQQEVKPESNGNMAMRLVVPAGTDAGRVGMRTFEKTFVPGTPSTFTARVRVDAPATVTAYQQWRGSNDRDRFEALANNRLRPIGKVEVEPGDWRELRFDFDSPRVSAVSYRVVLEIAPEDPTKEHISWFDDFGLIEWLTPPLREGPVPPHLSVGQASHADVTAP